MKFLCDNCQAQYMISDEKVGPAGVRVRCKKCSHVIYVKRLEVEAPPPEDATVVMTPERMAQLSEVEAGSGTSPNSIPPPVEDLTTESQGLAAPAKVGGLEEEIGQALDSMFSDGETAVPGAAPSGSSRAPIVLSGSPHSLAPVVPVPGMMGLTPMSEDSDRAETRIFSPSDMEKIAASTGSETASPPAPTTGAPVDKGTEWFIAVRDEQVGPLQIGQIKERFEAGEVAGDTLVWSTGLTDWRPLSTVEELAEHIIPKREITRTSRAPAAVEPAREAPKKEQVAFKPSAASALASLASMAKEEIAAGERSRAPLPQAAVPAASGGLEPGQATDLGSAQFLSGLPAPSPEQPAPPPAAAYAPTYSNGRGAPPRVDPRDYRQSPLAQSLSRSGGLSGKVIGLILGGLAVLVLLAGLGIYFGLVRPQQEQTARYERDRAEAQAKAQEAAAAAQAAAAAAAAAQAKAAAQQAAKPVPVAAPPPPVQQPQPKQAAAAESSHEKRAGKRRGKEAEANSAAPASPVAEKEKAPAKGADDFLAAGDVDKEFAKELDGQGGAEKEKSTRHAPYIPPPPGQADLPATLSQSDIVGAVTQHRDAFAKCVQDQKRREPGASGTVVMRWRIKPDGRTTDIAAKGQEFSDSPLAGCFKGQISKLHFGAYRGPQMSPIEFPFSF